MLRMNQNNLVWGESLQKYNARMHALIYVYIYIYIFMCVCVCVLVDFTQLSEVNSAILS